MENFYPIFLITILFCCFLIYQEIIRENKARRLLRVVAVIFLCLALLFLIVPLRIQSTSINNSTKLVLLTKGASKKDLKNDVYFSLDSSVLNEFGSSRIKYLPDLSYYLRAHPEVSTLKVYGYGLNSQELKNLESLHFEFEAPAQPDGIRSVSWPAVLSSSAALTIQGVFVNGSKNPVKLVLEGAGSRLDSLTIPTNSRQNFSLKAWPKQLGKAIYHLIAEQEDKQILAEDIPFKVIERPKLKILALSSSPDFEFKFLRNWLFENGYPAYFRTRISKDKFSTDISNFKIKAPASVSPSMLKGFDFVIADDEELAALSPGLRTALSAEVEKGLGLLVRVGEGKSISSFAKEFAIYPARDSLSESTIPVLKPESQQLAAIPLKEPLYIKPDHQELALVQNVKGSVLLSSKLDGIGLISVSTIGTTYNWVLSGKKDDYNQFWSYVINKVGRKTNDKLNWQVSPQFPIESEPASITFYMQSERPLPTLKVSNQIAPIKQHPLLPFYWQSSSLQTHSGWNQLMINNQPTGEFFVYKPKDWNSVQINNRIEENTILALKSFKGKQSQHPRLDTFHTEISKWWFFVLFMFSAAFLWLEAKYKNQ